MPWSSSSLPYFMFVFIFKINLPRATNNMIALSLKDATGVQHAEDYIKLSVGESKHIYPTKVSKRTYDNQPQNILHICSLLQLN